jgi:lactate dehydrogenase-like 2-hydroxyacid dehydrogenase
MLANQGVELGGITEHVGVRAMTQEIMQVSPLPPSMMKALQEADYIVHDHTHIKDPGALSKVTALIGTGAAKVDKQLLSMLPNLKLVAICGVGYDGVDVAACKEKGIAVTHTPGVLTDDVADMAMGLVLSMGRRIPQADKFVRQGDWVDDEFPLRNKVSGSRMGIVGMGRIGRAIAKRAAAFDMRIAYTGRVAKADVPYVFYETVTQLAANVDYLVIAVPGGDDTKHMIGASVLQALGSKGYLINIARGSVVDQPVLVQALKDKTIAGAALDVFWDEPIIDPELRRLSNVVLTPHIASATVETRQAMAVLTLDNLQAFYERRALPTPVPECQ